MAIYDLGTASMAVNGEVTGVGTTWKAPLTLIRVGSTILFKTEPVQIYTISEIISDTQINVYNPNSETVPAGTGYAILAHDGITVQGLAQDVAETLRYYQSRETEVSTAVDIFKDFDQDKFSNDVSQVNTQFGEIVTIGAQVSSDAAKVASDRSAAAASEASAIASKNAAAASAQEAADYAASLDSSNLLRKDLNFSDLQDKDLSRKNLGVVSEVENYINNGRVPSSYFGITGSGDETEKVRSLHSFANDNKLSVLYNVSEVQLLADANIEVKTSVDFNGCVIKPVSTAEPGYLTTPTFNITGNPLVDVTNMINKANYTKGTTYIDSLSSLSRKTVTVGSSQYFCYRSSLGSSGGVPSGIEYKTSINRIEKFGELRYPLEHSFNNDNYVSTRVRDDESFILKVSNATIDTSRFVTGVVFKCSRSQVVFNDHTLRDFQNQRLANIRQVYYLDLCVSQVYFNRIFAEANSSQETINGTYVFSGRGNCDVKFDCINSVQGWGSISFNVIQGLNVTNSTLNRVDVHYHGYNISIDNCILSEFGVTMGTGGGRLSVTNCSRIIPYLSDFYQYDRTNPLIYMLSVIYFRGDYGNYFDGVIFVSNIHIELATNNIFSLTTEALPAVISVVSFNSGIPKGSSSDQSYADFGYTSAVPWANSVTIRDVTLHLHNPAQRTSWISLTGLNYRKLWVAPSTMPAAVVNVDNLNFSHATSYNKVEPVVMTNLSYSTSLVASANKNRSFNCEVSISNINSGFTPGRAIMSGGEGTLTFDLLYTQAEVAAFPSSGVVPRFKLDNVNGIAGRASIPCTIEVNGGTLLGLGDSSGGRNENCWINFNGTRVYPLPNSASSSVSNLPRASWNGCRFVDTGVSPNVTIMDSMIGCTFDNGQTPIGLSSPLLGFTGVIGDSGGRIQ